MADALIMRRGGGRGASFTFKNVTSELLLPESAKDNTVTIVSATAVNNVYVGEVAPTSGMQNGDVWASIAPQGIDVEAVSKPKVVMRLGAIFQYNGAAWVQRKAFIWNNAQWTVTQLYCFYYPSELCVPVTGGWEFNYSAGANAYVNSGRLFFSYNSGSYNTARASTANKIQVGGYKYLHALMYYTTYQWNTNEDSMGFTDTKFGNYSAYARAVSIGTTEAEYTLDVSAAPEDYMAYLMIRAMSKTSATTAGTARVSAVWMTYE